MADGEGEANKRQSDLMEEDTERNGEEDALVEGEKKNNGKKTLSQFLSEIVANVKSAW